MAALDAAHRRCRVAAFKRDEHGDGAFQCVTKGEELARLLDDGMVTVPPEYVELAKKHDGLDTLGPADRQRLRGKEMRSGRSTRKAGEFAHGVRASVGRWELPIFLYCLGCGTGQHLERRAATLGGT